MEQNRERALHLKVAENENEYIGSFSLVHDVYSEMGVMEKKKNGMRVSVFNTLPSTKVLVLRNGREIASTMTLIFDSELGLPSDDLFREEIDAFRRKGLRILEVGAFASRKDVREQNPRIAIELCKAAIGFADYADVDILIAGVNPKYTRIYRKMLGFDFVGEPKKYPKVNNFLSHFGFVEKKDFRKIYKGIHRRNPDYNNQFYYDLEKSADLTESYKRINEKTFRKLFIEKENIISQMNDYQKENIMKKYPEFSLWKERRTA